MVFQLVWYFNIEIWYLRPKQLSKKECIKILGGIFFDGLYNGGSIVDSQASKTVLLIEISVHELFISFNLLLVLVASLVVYLLLKHQVLYQFFELLQSVLLIYRWWNANLTHRVLRLQKLSETLIVFHAWTDSCVLQFLFSLLFAYSFHRIWVFLSLSHHFGFNIFYRLVSWRVSIQVRNLSLLKSITLYLFIIVLIFGKRF